MDELDQKRLELLDHIRSEIDGQKQQVNLYYSELKLRIPAYLKNKTIGQLREVGAIVDPDIFLTPQTDDFLRSISERTERGLNLKAKLREVHEEQRNKINAYYTNIKGQLPPELLRKKMKDLTEEEREMIGIILPLPK